jgi:hypothetical protein
MRDRESAIGGHLNVKGKLEVVRKNFRRAVSQAKYFVVCDSDTVH